MSECGTSRRSDSNSPKRWCCPVNGKAYGAVGRKTILHHLSEPWRRPLTDQGYYFCSDPDCAVVYFGQDNAVIEQSELRTRVGVKERGPQRSVCYCFGVSYSAAVQDGAVVEFVKEQTKQSLCACETRNPAGRCCLKDFPKQ